MLHPLLHYLLPNLLWLVNRFTSAQSIPSSLNTRLQYNTVFLFLFAIFPLPSIFPFRGETSHSRAGETATEDLRKDSASLREHVHRELDEMRSKVARSTPQPQPKKNKTVASTPGAAWSEADPPGDASKACSPGGDEEAFIENAWMLVVKKAAHPNVRLERKVPQAPPREEQPSKTNKKKRRRGRRRKRALTKEVAPAARQQCKCTRAPNLLVGDSLVARETGRFFS